MSKSKGNVVDPVALSKEFGVDAVRYFLMREVPFGQDGDFSGSSMLTRYNTELANDLGNLLNRSLTMIEKYFNGSFEKPEVTAFDDLSKQLIDRTDFIIDNNYSRNMEQLKFSEVLADIFMLVNKANFYIEKEAPWALSKAGKNAELRAVMYNLFEELRIAAIMLHPFMPATSNEMLSQLGLGPAELDFKSRLKYGKTLAAKIKKGAPLFPRKLNTETKD
jgi:methionyl-tRNA synthetase